MTHWSVRPSPNLFGQRFELELNSDPVEWKNTRPDEVIPAQKVAEAALIPEKLLAAVHIRDEQINYTEARQVWAWGLTLRLGQGN